MPGQIIENVISELIELRDLNSKRASYSLFGLLAVFLLSLVFFLFSGVFTSNNSSEIDTYSLEKSVKEDLERLSVSTGETLASLQWYSGLSTEPLKIPNGLLPEAQLRERYDNLSIQKSALLKELEALQANRLSALRAKGEIQSVEEIIATSITRVGAVLLSVFMMQILLGFFRYFIRLTNYYGAKVVAVKSLSEGDLGTLAEIIKSVSSENINFGKEPQMPFNKVFELLKANK